MKVFTHTAFDGFYPVGVAAVIIAEDKQTAKILLEKKLEELKMTQYEPIKEEDFQEVDINTPSVDILNDGNY